MITYNRLHILVHPSLIDCVQILTMKSIADKYPLFWSKVVTLLRDSTEKVKTLLLILFFKS